MPEQSPLVQLDEVTRSYPGAVDVRALSPTSLMIDVGEYVAISGRSGSGKSTLLAILGMLDRPTSGTYRLSGVDVAELSERRQTRYRGAQIGFVFQAFHLLDHRSVVDNVALGLTSTTLLRQERDDRAREALERVGLSSRANFLPTTLSGGERQRVAIARALIGSPSLLLADEPTGNLDSTTANRILGLFAELHRSGQTLVVVTHDPDVAARATRRLQIADGVVSESA